MSGQRARRIQDEVEDMTRRLELEKRRLARIERELLTARRTHQSRLSVIGRVPPSRPSSRVEALPSEPAKPNMLPDPATLSPKIGNGGLVKGKRMSAAIISPEELLAVGQKHGLARGGNTEGQGFKTAAYKALVHRYDVQVKKLDSIRRENVQLQQAVDQLRKQRLQLNCIFERLKFEIRHRTAQLMDVNEEIMTGMTVQGDAKQRIAVMTRHRENERSRFKGQVLKMRSQLKECEFDRSQKEVELKRRHDGVQTKKELIKPLEEKDFCEMTMMRRIMKTAFLNCIQRRHIKQHEKTITLIEQAFATIKQSTGISNIEEIVKIFVHLESKNYSLLTYVNHMNTEIEALEALVLRRTSAETEWAELEAEQEMNREAKLGMAKRQYETKRFAIATCQEACDHHQDLIQKLFPFLKHLYARVQKELDKLKRAAGPVHGADVPALPVDLRAEDIPQWLFCVEKALGRFKDLIPPNANGESFPTTAKAQILRLPPKRLAAQQQPLVRAQELPCAASTISDDMPSQKRLAVTAAQKTEILDEEAEEEDFGDRPLALDELRARAVTATERREKRKRPITDAFFGSFVGGGGERVAGVEVSPVTTGEARPASPPPRRATFLEDDRGGSEGGGSDGSPREADNDGAGRLQRRAKKSLLRLSGDELRREISDEELSATFLKRYKMSREELEVMADRMGIHLANLCFLKQEFDRYDEDLSGYIDASELKGLLKKLGEELAESDIEEAFKSLDADGSGEIEFFEFVEWFTGGD